MNKSTYLVSNNINFSDFKLLYKTNKKWRQFCKNNSNLIRKYFITKYKIDYEDPTNFIYVTNNTTKESVDGDLKKILELYMKFYNNTKNSMSGGTLQRRYSQIQTTSDGSTTPHYDLLDHSYNVKILESSALQCLEHIENKWSSILNIKKDKLPFKEALDHYTTNLFPNKILRLVNFLKINDKHNAIDGFNKEDYLITRLCMYLSTSCTIPIDIIVYRGIKLINNNEDFKKIKTVNKYEAYLKKNVIINDLTVNQFIKNTFIDIYDLENIIEIIDKISDKDLIKEKSIQCKNKFSITCFINVLDKINKIDIDILEKFLIKLEKYSVIKHTDIYKYFLYIRKITKICMFLLEYYDNIDYLSRDVEISTNNIGSEYVCETFLSTSLSQEHSRRFLNESTKCCMFEIYIPANSYGLYITPFSSYTGGVYTEYEIILPPTSRFVVKNKIGNVTRLHYLGPKKNFDLSKDQLNTIIKTFDNIIEDINDEDINKEDIINEFFDMS